MCEAEGEEKTFLGVKLMGMRLPSCCVCVCKEDNKDFCWSELLEASRFVPCQVVRPSRFLPVSLEIEHKEIFLLVVPEKTIDTLVPWMESKIYHSIHFWKRAPILFVTLFSFSNTFGPRHLNFHFAAWLGALWANSSNSWKFLSVPN